MVQTPPIDILMAMRRMHLLDDREATGERLTGGVSSDIWRIDLPAGSICIKRALARLKVAADWRAPVERNMYEARWMRVAATAVPEAVPAVLGQDSAAGILAMEYLPPEAYRIWKSLLRDGIADADFAAAVADRLARIHNMTAHDVSLPAMFATDAIFHAIRLEPYLIATAQAHPVVSDRLHLLAALTASTRRALVHGDISPKNILAGPNGPVFLDAECAWWGDPAFDLSFCLNHLLLKCVWRPSSQANFFRCFEAMAHSYLSAVTWEPPDELEARAAHLLPALLLARVDGKSPVEYITIDRQRNMIRHSALRLLADPPHRLAAVADVFAHFLEQESGT